MGGSLEELNKAQLQKYIDLHPIAKAYQNSGVELDVAKRWEEGTPHHPKSKEIMTHIAEIDFCFTNDHFCWKQGGDGDNGEALMYLLDIYFEAKDKGIV